jgi:anti-sigma factor RsiW
MSCLAEQTINRYAQGALDEAVSDAVEQHIDHCAACRLAIAELARGRAPTEHSQLSVEPGPSTDSAAASRLGVQLKPGEVLGRYIIRRIVGVGGPTRMPYERAVPPVGFVSGVMSGVVGGEMG